MIVPFRAFSLGLVLLISGWSTASEEPQSLSLEGVIVADDPTHSVALVRQSGASRARVLRVGQELAGYVLVSVTRGQARLRSPSEDLVLSVGLSASNETVSDAPPVASVRAAPEFEWQRRAFSRSSDRPRLEKEIPVILSDTELTPRVEGGEIRGLELIRIPDGTLLSESGLRPGDVLQSLNGEPLIGLESLWELLARFDGKGELRLVVERRGEIVRLAYAIED